MVGEWAVGWGCDAMGNSTAGESRENRTDPDLWSGLLGTAPRWWQQKVVEPDCRETPVLKLSETCYGLFGLKSH